MPVSCQRPLKWFLGIALLAVTSSPAQTASPTPPETTQPGSAQSSSTLGAVSSFHALRDGIELQAGAATLRITALRDDIIRVRISPDALPEDVSWAVLPAARGKSVDVHPSENPTFAGFRTAALAVRVERSQLGI